jgi:hypothetical protein
LITLIIFGEILIYRTLVKAYYFVISVAEVDKPPSIEKDSKKLPETHPKNLADLESKISTLAVAAVAAYSDASSAIRG